ncbi:MAG: signal peptidase II [Acetobacteraceae bacterium]|nr:signal peptidase II [Acetobacteraceae bacterium]
MPLFAAAAGVLALDRLSKWLVQAYLDPGQSVPVLGPVMNLTLVHNPGAAFGLFPGQAAVFTALSLAILVILPLFAFRFERGRPGPQAALGAVVGGAAGNLLDRLCTGGVVDFLDFKVWPVFNLADAAIVTGLGLFLLGLIRLAARRPRKEA